MQETEKKNYNQVDLSLPLCVQRACMHRTSTFEQKAQCFYASLSSYFSYPTKIASSLAMHSHMCFDACFCCFFCFMSSVSMPYALRLIRVSLLVACVDCTFFLHRINAYAKRVPGLICSYAKPKKGNQTYTDLNISDTKFIYCLSAGVEHRSGQQNKNKNNNERRIRKKPNAIIRFIRRRGRKARYYCPANNKA